MEFDADLGKVSPVQTLTLGFILRIMAVRRGF